MRVNYKIADRLFMRKYCFVCYFTIETSKIIERIEQESNFNIAIEDLPSNSEVFFM